MRRITRVHTEGGDVLVPRKIRPTKEQIFGEVLPAILRALEAERHDDILTAALIAAARIASAGAPEVQDQVVRAISKHLSAPSIEVAETAVLSLGILASTGGLGTLLDIVEGGAAGCQRLGQTRVSIRMRSFAAIGLGLMGERHGKERQRIALALMEAASEESQDDELTVACLIGIGLNPVPCEPTLPPRDLRGRPLALAVSSRSGQTSWIAELAFPSLVQTKARRKSRNLTISTLARTHATTALARLGTGASEGTRAGAIQILHRAALSRNYSQETRTAAWTALGEVTCSSGRPGDAAALEAMASIAKTGHPLERRMALISLARASTRPDPKSGELEALVSSRHALMRRLDNGSHQDRAWAALALGLQIHRIAGEPARGGEACAKRLRFLLSKAKNQLTVGAFALATALAHVHADIPAARRASEDLLEAFERTGDPKAKSQVALALGMLGEKRATAHLEGFLERSRFQPSPLWSAAVSLDMVETPEILPRLVEVLKAAKAGVTRAAVASALGRVGDHTAVAPMLELLEGPSHQTSSTRAFAIVGLGVLCDDDPVHWRTSIAHALPYFASTATLWGRGQGVLDII